MNPLCQGHVKTSRTLRRSRGIGCARGDGWAVRTAGPASCPAGWGAPRATERLPVPRAAGRQALPPRGSPALSRRECPGTRRVCSWSARPDAPRSGLLEPPAGGRCLPAPYPAELVRSTLRRPPPRAGAHKQLVSGVEVPVAVRHRHGSRFTPPGSTRWRRSRAGLSDPRSVRLHRPPFRRRTPRSGPTRR